MGTTEQLDPVTTLRSYLWLPLSASGVCLVGLLVIIFTQPLTVAAGGSIGLLAAIVLNIWVYLAAKRKFGKLSS